LFRKYISHEQWFLLRIWAKSIETFWKGFTFSMSLTFTCDSQEEAKISTLMGVWKKWIPALKDDDEGLRIQWRKWLQMLWEQFQEKRS
jgi:hypothetical protein